MRTAACQEWCHWQCDPTGVMSIDETAIRAARAGTVVNEAANHGRERGSPARVAGSGRKLWSRARVSKAGRWCESRPRVVGTPFTKPQAAPCSPCFSCQLLAATSQQRRLSTSLLRTPQGPDWPPSLGRRAKRVGGRQSRASSFLRETRSKNWEPNYTYTAPP